MYINTEDLWQVLVFGPLPEAVVGCSPVFAPDPGSVPAPAKIGSSVTLYREKHVEGGAGMAGKELESTVRSARARICLVEC